MQINKVIKRFAGQEINPIIYRMHTSPYEMPYDRNPIRTWSHVFFASHHLNEEKHEKSTALKKGYRQPSFGLNEHYATFVIQGLRMKRYFDGYFDGKAFIAEPHVHRTVAGNFVRLFIYNPLDTQFNYEELRSTLEKVFGMFQGPGTSGLSKGRVKTVLDVVELPSPLLNAEILASFVGHHLQNSDIKPAQLFDRLGEGILDKVPRKSEVRGLETLPVAGFRVRVKGRVRGEEMAVKYDYLKGSCPKSDKNALMDFGKTSYLGRSGVIGVKAWVHFQRPQREDATGQCQNLFSQGEKLKEEESENSEEKIDLLAFDRDYDEVHFENKKSSNASKVGGLWNVERSDDVLVKDLVMKLKDLHTPCSETDCRFLW